jgi:hypothetical protein
MTDQQEREAFEAWWDAGFSKILPATYGKSEGWAAWQERAANVPETDCGNINFKYGRWSFPPDGFGVVSDNTSGNYVYFDDAIHAVHTAMQCRTPELIEAARLALDTLNRALPFVESKADELETLHDENDESETYEGYRCACDVACATTDAISALKEALK